MWAVATVVGAVSIKSRRDEGDVGDVAEELNVELFLRDGDRPDACIDARFKMACLRRSERGDMSADGDDGIIVEESAAAPPELARKFEDGICRVPKTGGLTDMPPLSC